MPIDADAVLAHLDAAACSDWPQFRGISSFEPHAMRLVVLRERDTSEWGLVFETICGEILDPDLPIGIGVATKIYGPSVPPHAVNVPVRRPVPLTATEHDRFAILPSESATYRSLALALAADDPTLFVPGPTNLDHRLWATEPDANAT